GFERRLGMMRGLVINPHQTRTYLRTQNAPAGAPAGTYDVTVYAGDFPAGPLASAVLTVEKLPAAAPAPPARVSGPDGGWDGTWAEADAPLTTAAAGAGAAALLSPPAPNPSAGRTTLAFTLAAASDVRLAVYDAL